MGIGDKFRKVFNIDSDYYDEYDEDEYEEYDEAEYEESEGNADEPADEESEN